ncbi:baseplate J/gp47 family protein [Terrimonas sp. NA20]|uniref:Baseplate J/gp47 family protein n=1 Tax=Terrimonas ginsenosidimutans TaxID=2908004 RepID=A0ABS9KRI0_9BACT|nr:baseplate J/gp47 family protein [Terrimonas ginsenosidimutans]MCG2614908.1 baseplate J/gp47 family protein [Terrimonas ginsenosidimutans]
MALNQIQFFHEDSAKIIAECKEFLESKLGRQIAPADVEMLLINGLAYRELIVRAQANDAARQSLVSFARAAALEYLGELVGVRRLPSSSATCQIQFALVAGHNGVIIPAGLRVQSTDGKVTFATTEEKIVPAGTMLVNVGAEAAEPGKVGNGYELNKVNIILDPLAFVSTAQNLTTTSGGADEESDDLLRERIKLAPASFSVAGPDDAYKFHAKSAHPTIVDVAITSPIPGDVHIFPLIEGGNMPTQEILDAIQAICNSKKIRPLTDSVYTNSPSKIDFEIQIDLTLLTNAVADTVKTAVENILEAYRQSRKNRLGLDVVRAKLVALSMIEGVYMAEPVLPLTNIIALPEEYTNCTGITVNVIGTHDE